jgi:hypothetical protein
MAIGLNIICVITKLLIIRLIRLFFSDYLQRSLISHMKWTYAVEIFDNNDNVNDNNNVLFVYTDIVYLNLN